MNFRIILGRWLAVLACCAGIPLLFGCGRSGFVLDNAPSPNSTLVIVLDGLRPDHVTPEQMPHVSSLRTSGVWFEDHHSVFPTLTRVNSASFATGAYPSGHGLMGNRVYFPEIHKGWMTTGDARALARIEEGTGGNLLTAPTLGELLAGAERKYMVVSAFSSGAAYILGYGMDAENGFGTLIQPELFRPASLRAEVEARLGPGPSITTPNEARNRWAVDAYLEFGLDRAKPDVAFLWLGEPDQSQHERGIGHPETLQALAGVDAEVGRILQGLRERRLLRSTNVLVVSDHGFSSNVGGGGLTKLLVKSGLKESNYSDDVVVVENEIYVKGRDREKIRQIIEVLQETEWVGPIFTHRARPTHPEGFVPGTLSFHAIHKNHDRVADIAISPAWSDAENEFGLAGTVALSGKTSHGSASPYDLHAVLIAAGPDFKEGGASAVASANFDLAPTICALYGIEPAEKMDGRVLKESLKGGPEALELSVLGRKYRSRKKGDADAAYRVEMREISVDGTDYMHSAEVIRGDGK